MHPFEAITSHEWSVPAELGLPWIPAEQVIGMFPCMTTTRIYSSFFYLPVRNTQKIEAFKARQQTWPVCYAHECSISYLFNNLNSCDHVTSIYLLYISMRHKGIMTGCCTGIDIATELHADAGSTSDFCMDMFENTTGQVTAINCNLKSF